MGPLGGLRVVEMAGIGAGPFCGMLLSDMGADVVRIDRTAPSGLGFDTAPRHDFIGRGRRSVAIDLKSPEGAAAALRLIGGADALVESFRPGVMERLGLGPEACLARNPRLVYGRLTGWGQTGPLAPAAGHDINYVALSGALHAIGPAEGPAPPLNLVGDFGGGALYLAFGIACALIEAARSGRGQVVDAAMVDGATSLMTMLYGLRAEGRWGAARMSNDLDGGAPFYGVYETRDGAFVALGPIEAKFYRVMLDRLGLAGDPLLADPGDRARWPAMRARLAEVFRTRTREEWRRLLEGTDACFAPVLSMDEAPSHPHMRARGAFVEVGGLPQPAPAPRLDRTPGAVARPAPALGQHSTEILADWGFEEAEIAALVEAGHVLQS
jgi:alpha-methylacyl-CoA racemase